MNILRQLFFDKPYLAWFVKEKQSLSTESMLEHLFNYGAWQDYTAVEKEMGIERVKDFFMRLAKAKRSNLRPKTMNYFRLYFSKYA